MTCPTITTLHAILAAHEAHQGPSKADTIKAVAECLSALECAACNGRGVVGTFMRDGSFDGQDCPDCALEQQLATEAATGAAYLSEFRAMGQAASALTELGDMALRSLIERVGRESSLAYWDRGFYRGQISVIACYMTPDAALLDAASRAVDVAITGASNDVPVAPVASEVAQSELCRAAIQCHRIIDDDEIVLWRDHREPGSALDQLDRRISSAIAQPVATQGEQDVLSDEALREAVAESLRGMYGCGRVWSAWNVGTMREDDFYPAEECDECITQVADAVRAAILAAKGGAV